jgi:hypothetical protein
MEKIKGVVCSTSHLTEEDYERFEGLSSSNLFNHCDWIHDTGYGYLIRLNAHRFPLLALKERYVSKSTRKLIYTLMRTEEINMIHFDRDADVLDGFEIFDW